jgi:hypothetical protein
MNEIRCAWFGFALASTAAADAVAAAARSASAVPVGAMNFWCALFQTIKVVSLVTGQLEGVVVGAIGGGLACGMGW